MKNGRGVCYIVGAGENYGLDFTPEAEDYVIAADAGLRFLQEAAIDAHLAVGDFDTLEQIPAHGNVIALDRVKDETDAFAALRFGMKKGYRVFHFYCCTGGRIDHTLANIQILSYLAQRRMRGFLHGNGCVMTAITSGAVEFGAVCGGYLSVFSLTGTCTGVNLRGLKYELFDAVLTNDFPLGVSNEFIGEKSRVAIGSGTALVVFPTGALREAVFFS